ncbi:hypothetical protein SAMN03159341_104304 [Paenibacillus sp. 1_12]|uniref:hypothetical protein n=1 Tax=Paenibacillus sp. 1_12 TaxID=1566278 RepID=UPI0008E9D82E|nr:hypothetical protein [Paenibacillus sp. 1_12]SFL26122.1 hypothetical protein SAMN03159341_104304 [Paenibacillus sp. 1_12]
MSNNKIHKLKATLSAQSLLLIGLSLCAIWSYYNNNLWDETGRYLSSTYSIPIAVMAVLLYGLGSAAYYRFVRKPAEITEVNKVLLVWLLLGTGLLLQIVAAPWFVGHPFDNHLFHSWAGVAVNRVSGFYVSSSNDYPS